MHKWAYIIMAVLTAVLVIMSVVSTVTGSSEIFSEPAVYMIFGIYFAVQVICVFLMRPTASVYRIGFYFIHVGIPIMLIGFALYGIFGKTLYSNVPVDSNGLFYTGINDENGIKNDLGFGFKADTFEIEHYESGSEKYYGADISVYDINGRTGAYYNSGAAKLEVNNTFRKNGWKLYFMGYNDGVYSNDGTYLLPYGAEGALEPVLEFVTNDGGKNAEARLLSNNMLSGANVTYLIYNGVSSTYIPIGTDAAALESIGGRVTVRVYESGALENSYYVYAAQTTLLILFKRDPGEFFVIVGMVMTMIGIVMMCLIGGKHKDKNDGVSGYSDPVSTEKAEKAEKEKGGDKQ